MFEPNIIFEDSDILIVNKPAGLASQDSQKGSKKSLYTHLQEYLKNRDGDQAYLALHHRLDAQTSGLMLFCKAPQYNKFITDLFREKKIIKKYITRVDLSEPIENENWSVENKLIEFRFKHFKKAKASASGKTAITHFKLLAQDQASALIECSPQTGRLHQIRVHLADLKTPIQGDFHYNKNYKSHEFKLCAFHLSFHHPRTNKFLTFEIEPEFS